jgi:hypothetical protein
VKPRYLFVTGCPRSGTTALATLLNSHAQIAIGIERYGNRFYSREFLDRSLFERDRFFDLQPGDTFWTDLDHPNWIALREKYNRVLYRGDKIPFLYRHLDRLDAEFGDDLHVLMIVRRIGPIAASYEGRRNNPHDTAWRGHDAMDAVEHWRQALEAAASRAHDPRYHMVSYHDLYEEEMGLEALFGVLDLPVTESVREQYSSQLAMAVRLADVRTHLPSDLLEHIQDAAPHDLYNRIARLTITRPAQQA